MARSTSPHPSISLMDIFIGSGRTIRRPTGPPGMPFLQIHPTRKTELVQVRRKSSGDPKPATPVKPSSNKAIAGSDAKSNSKKEDVPAAPKSSSKKEEAPSGSKPNSKKDDSPPESKPSSSKEDIAPHESKPSSSKSDSKSNSKKGDGKPNSKPTSAKAPSEEKAADDKEAGAKKSDGKKPEEPVASGSKPQANDQQPSDLIVFTAEEDAKILQMKTDGVDAKVIGAEIGKGKKQVNKRFDQIKPKDWKPEKARKDAAAAAEMKKDKPSEKQLSKVLKKDEQAVEVKPKSNAVEKMRKPEDAPKALLLAGKVQHQHDVRHRHAHQHDHHIHVHDTHESRPRHDKDRTHESRPRHRSQPVLDPTDSGYGSNNRDPNSNNLPHHSRRPRPPPSIAASTAYTIKTMPSLTEDDLFSFGELQALSELIGKDMEGMWHRVSAAFFGMTGRRIPAEDIKEKFEGLEVE
ncbi:hypothetical protein D6D01_03677 [Aureobasidium pullulans]|uniref:Myb-like domain-containing protein n=1 Tax=Aureobasidium pullulans TaxID=5580 RepID=A0A4S9LIE0_AURPU|nr:hypothetical protein D6D01_03677 [Aureobasidium pullulans]